MLELMDNISNENLVIICFILGTIALVLAIAISIEIYLGNKKYKELVKDDKELENTNSRLNIKEDLNVKYVEEMDSELEKTKAKVELQELREKLKKEEEEKKKLLDANLALAGAVANSTVVENKEEKEEIEKLEDTIVDLQPIKTEVKPTVVNIEPVVEPVAEKIEENYDDENEAIISYDELKSAKNFGYTDEEMSNYVDEKDAIISMQELEKLYYESQKIEVPLEDTREKEFKRVEDLPEIADNNGFKTSSYVSPIYGKAKTDQDLILEQTANLEKLNEEIKKTNEFLKMLKDLKKNLE